MIKYIGKKLIEASLLIFCVILLNFLMLSAAPGDIVDSLIAQAGGGTAEQAAALRDFLGLSGSVVDQFIVYFKEILKGNLGHSFYYSVAVSDVIWDRLPNTLILVVPAITFAAIFGSFLGIISAIKRDGLVNHIVTFVSLSGFAAPTFWSGMVLLVVFSYWIPIFPAGGMYEIGMSPDGLDLLIQLAYHAVLPIICLASIYLAQYSRQGRAAMLDVLTTDYIRTARAKGLRSKTVLFRHALRNAMLPLVTMAGLQFAEIIAGAVVVETVFNWPGMGRLALDAVLFRDYQLLLGILLIASFLVIIANIATDIIYRLVDPRLRIK